MISEGGRISGQQEIRGFTGLRGCAALMVMFYHFTLNMPNPTSDSNLIHRLLENGYLWVDLFFILSGFVMAHSQADTFSRGQPLRSHATFLLSRIARVYPLYLIILLESACLMLWRTPHPDPGAFLRTFFLNLIMVQAWGLAPSMEGAAWSISTEWAAYLLFPLFFAITILSSRRTAGFVALAALITIGFLAVSPEPFRFPEQGRGGPLDIYSSATPAPLFRCLAEFNLGLLAYRLAKYVGDRPHKWCRPVSMLIMVAILGAMCSHSLDVPIVVLFVCLLVTLAPQTGILSRALGSRIPYTLGQWSYSIYLIHDKFSHSANLLERLLTEYVPYAAVFAEIVTAGMVIICSAATFMFVERPMRTWLRQRMRRTPVVRAHQQAPSQAVSVDVAPSFEVLAERPGVSR